MNTSKRILSMLLAVALMVSAFVIPASAAAKQTTTEFFVDSDGETITKTVTSTTDAKDAPAIDGYTYSSQSTETTHVYAEQHITYIIGYPNGGVGVENNMTRCEAIDCSAWNRQRRNKKKTEISVSFSLPFSSVRRTRSRT